MRKLTLFIFLLVAISLRMTGQDKLVDILEKEVVREMEILAKQDPPVYYLSYRVDNVEQFYLNSSFGSVARMANDTKRVLTVTLRVGSPQLDNFHILKGNSTSLTTETSFPILNEPTAIQQMLWSATNDAYQQAVNSFTKVVANIVVKNQSEDKSPDFVLSAPNVYIEPEIEKAKLAFDTTLWLNRAKKYSGIFLSDTSMIAGNCNFSVAYERKYFVSSNGDKIAQNRLATNLDFGATIKAADGMELPLNQGYFATSPSKLESDETMYRDAQELLKNLIALKNAPVAEPFSGPALLSGKASGVFFHEIFGHRIEGQRMKNETDAQTFKKKVNETVLTTNLSVYSDPQKETLGKIDLNGFYKYDDEGAMGKRVDIVQDGVLKDFLMSRTPIENFLNSNGHGRAQAGNQPVARQSNLIVSTSKPLTEQQLRDEMVKLLKEQNKPYGYLFKEVVGGFTQTSRLNPNSFNVTPTLVYRVYADGRADEIVRGVDLIGTPLSMFSQIDKAGGETDVFNGYCGAESGSVPVSCISPMVLVKNIETQKKTKSQEKSNILPRPDKKDGNNNL